MLTILTPHTRLEVVGAEHAERVAAYYQRNAQHLAPWEPARPADYHDVAQWQERARQWRQHHAAGLALPLVALSQDGARMLAACNFTSIAGGPAQSCNLGYSIDGAEQGRGLMGEVVGAAVEHVFTHLDLHRIAANYMPENERSGALLARLGFQREGYARSFLKIAGRWRDHVLTAKINPAHGSESA